MEHFRLSNIRKNNRATTKGRQLQKIQLIERDEDGKPVLDIKGYKIPILNKFKFIKHKIID